MKLHIEPSMGRYDIYLVDEGGHHWQVEQIWGGVQIVDTARLCVLTVLVDNDHVDHDFVKYTMVFDYPGHCNRYASGGVQKNRMDEWLSQTATDLTR